MKQSFLGMKQSIILLIFTLSILLLIVPTSVNAIDFEYYGIKINIIDENLIKNEIALEFDKAVKHLDYSLDFNIENLEVLSNFEETNCRVLDTDKGSDIICDFVGDPIEDGNRFIRLFFDTSDVITKEKNNFIFNANYDVPILVKDVLIIVTLPKNAALVDIFPPNPSTATINKSITVLWNIDDLVDEKINFSVKYSIPVLSEEFYILFVVTITLIVIIAMISMILYVKRSPKKSDGIKIEFKTEPIKIEESKIETLKLEETIPETKPEELKPEEVKVETKEEKTEERSEMIKVFTSILREDERKVVDILERHEGKVIQKTIVRETDFSKAKVSRLVKNLKERGIVDAEPLGRTTKVTLKIKSIIAESLKETNKEEEDNN